MNRKNKVMLLGKLLSGEINKEEFTLISKYGIPAVRPLVVFDLGRPTVDINQFEVAKSAYKKIGEKFEIIKVVNVSTQFRLDENMKSIEITDPDELKEREREAAQYRKTIKNE